MLFYFSIYFLIFIVTQRMKSDTIQIFLLNFSLIWSWIKRFSYWELYGFIFLNFQISIV